jgi:hypothetical protein
VKNKQKENTKTWGATVHTKIQDTSQRTPSDTKLAQWWDLGSRFGRFFLQLRLPPRPQHLPYKEMVKVIKNRAKLGLTKPTFAHPIRTQVEKNGIRFHREQDPLV